MKKFEPLLREYKSDYSSAEEFVYDIYRYEPGISQDGVDQTRVGQVYWDEDQLCFSDDESLAGDEDDSDSNGFSLVSLSVFYSV